MRSALLLLALVACGSAESTSTSSTESNISTATIDFAKDWSVNRSGDLVPGSTTTIRYDLSRLSKCRATKYGLQAWAVAAYASFDGQKPVELLLAPIHPNANQTGYIEFALPIPIASDLALWFHDSDYTGCSEWDSKYGQDFHFPIQKPNTASIRFNAGWTTTVNGIVHAGEDIVVDYDLARTQCKSTYNGNDAFGVTMWTSIDGGQARSTEMTQAVLGHEMALPARVTLPHGSHQIAIWFENNDTYGCHSWDSAYGANYVWNF